MAVVLVAALVLAVIAVMPDHKPAAGKARATPAGPTAGAVAPPNGAGSPPVSGGASAPAGDGGSPSGPAGATPSAPAGGAAPGGTATRPALPPGWQDYHDPTGFSVYVPVGWTRSKEGSIVYFRAPGRVLGIDQTDQPKSDPVADWTNQRNHRVAAGNFPGYHEIKIAPVDYFQKAADWEFTFDRNGRQHVNNRGVVTSPHQAYGLYWQTGDADWATALPDLQLVFASFVPAGS
jgi:hypothetical protein